MAYFHSPVHRISLSKQGKEPVFIFIEKPPAVKLVFQFTWLAFPTRYFTEKLLDAYSGISRYASGVHIELSPVTQLCHIVLS